MACHIRAFDPAVENFAVHGKSNEDRPCITAYFRCSPAINDVAIRVLDIAHLDVLALRSAPFASLAFSCTIRLLAYTNTILSIVIVISFILISTLSLNRCVVDGSDSSFCQRSKIFVAKPVQDVGVVFASQDNMFNDGSRDPCGQKFVRLSELSMSKLFEPIV